MADEAQDVPVVRYNAGGNGVQSGYEGIPVEESVPSCTIEDIDKSLHELFSRGLRLSTAVNSQNDVKVLWAKGERWSSIKRHKQIRDENGAFILPLVAIERTSIEQTKTDISGRGTNQTTGKIDLYRRLSVADAAYQNWLNRKNLRNQANVRIPKSEVADNSLQLTDVEESRVQEISDDRSDRLITDANREPAHVWEVVTIPTPEYITLQYSIVIWAQYTTQMNSMLQQIFAAKLPQGGYRISTGSGYWFVCTFDERFEQETFAEDGKERYVKCKFSVKVPAYLVAQSAPGIPNATRKYIIPTGVSISFGSFGEVEESESEAPLRDPDWLADDPTFNPRQSYRDDLFPTSLANRRRDEARGDPAPYEGYSRDGKFARKIVTNRNVGESVVIPLGTYFSLPKKN